MVNESDVGFYYSGAVSNEQLQDDPNKSLGGYRSSVIVFNGMTNNLLDELGIFELNNGQSVYRCIFIKNNHATDPMTNLSLYINGKQDFEIIKFGVSIPVNNISNVQFLNNENAMPYNIDFYEAYLEVNKIILKSSLASGDMIALWINREVTSGSTIRNINGQLNFNFSWT